ncbi:MAG: hypothetical protein ABIT20_21275, partial [Gemmatimonadaceae bacterium]
MLLAAAIVLAVAALAAAGHALRQAKQSRRDLHAAHARLARIDAEMPNNDDQQSVGVEALRRDVRVNFEQKEVEHDRILLQSLLCDFRDVAGAEEAIFWRWRAERDSLSPAVWSSEAPRP